MVRAPGAPARDYPAIARKYAADVVAGTIPAGKSIRLQCQRFVDELKLQKTAAFPYRFDEDRAARPCRFIEKLPHTKGEWARQKKRLVLEPWQIWNICVVFGWLHKAGSQKDTRRFRRWVLVVPRKNGKSAIAAGVGLYMLCADGEFGAEIYSGATNEKQAGEVFRPARLIVDRFKPLRDRFRIQLLAKTLLRPDDGSKFETIVGDPGDGQSPMRAWREPVGAGGAIVAGTDGMNDVGGFTVMNLLGRGRTGAGGSEERAMSTPAVLRALEVLCGLYAMTPCHYYRKTPEGKVRFDDAPQAQMMLTSANAVQPAYLLKELMLGDLLMRGKFGAYVHRDARYRPKALSRLVPDGIAPVQHWDETDGLEMFYDVQLPDGQRRRLTRNDMWFVPGFSRDGLVGVDRLKLLADSFEAAASTNEFASRFWENNAQPSTVLTTKGKVSPEEKLKIRNDWRERFAGTRNAGATAVLDQEMKAEFLSHTNKDAQFIETRSFSVVEVARAFGVPPHVLFELSKATFSNIEQQSLELYLYSMLNHFARAEAHLNHQFAEDGCFFEFLPEALLKGDLKSRYEAYAIGIDKGILNPDEVRDMENRNKRPGGEKYRVGSGSTIEGEAPTPPDKAPPAPEPETEEE